ncbi:hypothetical protein KMC57_gp31 [Achromobacter phage vB_AxyP_19-32_Axy24]|uniref:Uncharacterized protein n=1 Tax=Achromobacter phage vB_AxyP_19-32_Axy24 TaxID=2591048 RepID=A0A514CWD0_9CAUD|nr:hypothetical protein KMC57_gp31 [Achromobacter phage vB_AxyP_19-32_Axy24]QDH84794.1 hypothetical protein Axy24_031 [Achromobacter phage vB_AxyP_19-32_Axy24]
MAEPTIINKPGYNDRPYIAGFDGKQIGLYACSLAEAKQRAIEHFKPKKSKKGLLWVELAEE